MDYFGQHELSPFMHYTSIPEDITAFYGDYAVRDLKKSLSARVGPDGCLLYWIEPIEDVKALLDRLQITYKVGQVIFGDEPVTITLMHRLQDRAFGARYRAYLASDLGMVE